MYIHIHNFIFFFAFQIVYLLKRSLSADFFWVVFSGLTRLLEDGAPLVVGRSQAGGPDIVQARFVNAGIEDAKQRLLFFPLGHNFVVNEGGKHLSLDEMGEEGKVGLWLVGQERGLTEVKTNMLSEVIQKNTSDSITCVCVLLKQQSQV